jgi:zinc transporter ZupT
MTNSFMSGCSRTSVALVHLCDVDDDEFLNVTEFATCVGSLVSRSFGASMADGHSHGHDHKKKKKRGIRAALQRGSRKRAAAAEQAALPACKSAAQLLVDYDVDNDDRLSVVEFGFAVPSLLLLSSGACVLEGESACTQMPPTAAESWGAGIGVSILLSFVSLCGIVLIPFQNRSFRERVMTPMISFAVGALIGDAFLHMIPQVLGVHSHDDEGEEGELAFVWYMMVTLLGVVAFFILERHIEHMHGPDDHHEHHHHDMAHVADSVACENPAHEHDQHQQQKPAQLDSADQDASSDSSSGRRRPSSKKRRHSRRKSESKRALTSESPSTRDDASSTSVALALASPKEPTLDALPAAVHSHSHGETGTKQRIATLGWLNLISDAVHNFVDGIALGAAFSFSLEVGLATSIAIFCHELPQELADFAILTHAGFTKKQALGLNLLCSLSSVLGAAIGLGIGTTAVRNSRWLLAFTAGNFLYIALADMVQSLHQVRGWRQTILQSFAMSIGILIMLAITFIEEALEPANSC